MGKSALWLLRKMVDIDVYDLDGKPTTCVNARWCDLQNFYCETGLGKGEYFRLIFELNEQDLLYILQYADKGKLKIKMVVTDKGIKLLKEQEKAVEYTRLPLKNDIVFD